MVAAGRCPKSLALAEPRALLVQATAPWPGPDHFESGYVVDCFNLETIAQRARLVYEAAAAGYLEMVANWFSGLSPDLEMAQTLRGRLQGLVYIGNSAIGRFPGMTYAFLPGGDRLVVEIGTGTQREADDFGAQMLAERRGYSDTDLHDVLGDDPATELAYDWLREDLRRIAWVR